jgi:dTDP-4-amino-4,6-dideoxygalactose transaminase
MVIPYGRHDIDESDISEVVKALKSDWLTTGPLVEMFEGELEKRVGAPTVTVSSGTAALHCAYAAIDLQHGDEVITPPITFVATQATAALFGAKIIFADVLQDTTTINPTLVESLITPKTKAIVAVDYAGHPAEMDELREISNHHGIYLIEDAAHSIGSTYKNNPVGSLADLTTFSFFPTKNITSGEGGAISSNNPDLLLKAKQFARQGMLRERNKFILDDDGPWHQEVHNFGLNYRLPDILCALGISQLKKLDQIKNRREEIFQRYTEGLSKNKFLHLPEAKSYVSTNWHLYPLRVAPEIRLPLFHYLREHEVSVQVNYMPAYRHPVFNVAKEDWMKYPVSERFYQSEISLPMFAKLEDSQVDYVISIILEFISST